MKNEIENSVGSVVEDISLSKLTKDLKTLAESMTDQEARIMVNLYYTFQHHRIKAGNAAKAISKMERPVGTIKFLTSNVIYLEKQMKSILTSYIKEDPTSQWAQSLVGIGPIFSAGMKAYIDITRAPTTGHIWRYAGLDPTSIWEKGKLRPWNAKLKSICYLMGKSFVITSSNKNGWYGKLYKARKMIEIIRNENLEFKNQAAQIMTEKDYSRDTKAKSFYEKGMLPPAHIDARSHRYAVTIFLSHWHEVKYWNTYHMTAPRPYVFDHMGHSDIIAPLNFQKVDGLKAALDKRNPYILMEDFVEGVIQKNSKLMEKYGDKYVVDDEEPEIVID